MKQLKLTFNYLNQIGLHIDYPSVQPTNIGY